LEWAMENGKVKEAARMISSIDYFLYYKDRQVEGYRWFKRVLARSEAIPQVHQPRILLGAGRLAWVNSEASQSRNFFEKGLTLAQEMGDRRNEGWLLINLSTSLIDQPEEHEAAIRLCREGLMILREIDEKPGIAQGLNMLGELARATGDYARAGQMYEECIAVSQETGETFRQVMGLGNLAFVATHEEDYDRARNLLFSAIQRWRELGSWHGMTTGMAYLAGPLAGLGEPEKAARLLGASDALLAARGFDINLSDQHEYAKYVAEVKFQLDETTFEAAYAEGKAMTLEQAVAYALDDERY
jgi:tetratricopeptide (TPR) repeat protein